MLSEKCWQLDQCPIRKVKYQVTHQSLAEDDDEDSEEKSLRESKDEEEGLPKKLLMSSFTSAIRSTVANGLPALKVG